MTSTGFPQPTRPDNSYSPRFPTETPYPPPQFLPSSSYQLAPQTLGETRASSFPVTAYPVPAQLVVPPPVGFPVESTVINRDESISTEEERESIDELKRGIMELYNKLPASIRSKINLNKFHIPNDVVTDFKADDARSREVRGIVDQLSPKLERFKVRTVRGGVVTVDDDDADAGDKTRFGT
ncbi:hypothetical protein LINGRAHAP2_LOCUS35249 [Linum grandiflorum]